MKTRKKMIWLVLFVTVFLQFNCSNEKIKKMGPLKNESYQIIPMEFADEATLKILNHVNIFNPVRFRIDYKTNKSKFHFWAEIWRKDQLEVKQIMNLNASEKKIESKEGLGEGFFEVEITQNNQMERDFDRMTINTILRTGGSLFSSIDIENPPGLGVISSGFEGQEDYSTSEKFYYIYACLGEGGCSTDKREFPYRLNDSSQTGKEIYIHYRGGFFNSSKEFIGYMESIYEKYRPVKSSYNIFPEDTLNR